MASHYVKPEYKPPSRNVPCPVCGGDYVQVWIPESRDNYTIVRCTDCQLVYVNPQPVNWSGSELGPTPLDLDHLASQLQKRFKFTREWHIGIFGDPGVGSLFRLMGCRNVYVIADPTDCGDGITGQLDLAVLWDWVGAQATPRPALEAIANLMTPNGKLVVMTPDITSFTARQLSKKWPMIQSRYLVYYSKLTLRRLFESSQFEWKGSEIYWERISVRIALSLWAIRFPRIQRLITLLTDTGILSRRLMVPTGQIIAYLSMPSADKL